MEYISAEEFLKQPKEVQEVFIDWWSKNKTISDIATIKINKERWGVHVLSDIDLVVFEIGKDLIPLLTEGQLRKFIEDKVGYMDITLNDIADNSGNKNYEIECYPYILFEGFGDSKVFNIWADNLLQAYWKVAVQIAKEC